MCQTTCQITCHIADVISTQHLSCFQNCATCVQTYFESQPGLTPRHIRLKVSKSGTLYDPCTDLPRCMNIPCIECSLLLPMQPCFRVSSACVEGHRSNYKRDGNWLYLWIMSILKMHLQELIWWPAWTASHNGFKTLLEEILNTPMLGLYTVRHLWIKIALLCLYFPWA